MKNDKLYLSHIQDACDAAINNTNIGKEAFFANRQAQDATVRNLEVIGEAVKRLSEELRNLHPNIQWKQIAGMRDRLIHNYFQVDLEIVWETTQQDLPKLKTKIEEILS
jgi:uncharacterized protein with HEPN domain